MPLILRHFIRFTVLISPISKHLNCFVRTVVNCNSKQIALSRFVNTHVLPSRILKFSLCCWEQLFHGLLKFLLLLRRIGFAYESDKL